MYEIRTAYKERVTSLGLNKKIKGLVGDNSILSGFNVTFSKGSISISNGICFIEGAYIESKYNSNLTISIPQSLITRLDLWISLQYNHQEGSIREVISDVKPSEKFSIILCKLKKSGESFLVEASEKIYSLGEASATTQATKKKLDELEKIYNNQIANSSVSNPSNQETVDARGGYATLKARLDGMDVEFPNQVNQVKESLVENANSIKELQDLTPVWQEHSGTKHITVNDSFEGFAKDLVIKGRTLQNLNVFGTKLDFYSKGATWCHTGYSSNFLLVEGKTYSILITGKITDLASIQLGHANSASPQQVALNAYDVGTMIAFTAKNITKDGIGIILNKTSTSDWVQSELDSVRMMILEGDWTNKPIPSYFDNIVSSGENEGNKIIVKSVGKNLFNPLNENTPDDGWISSGGGTAVIQYDVANKGFYTLMHRDKIVKGLKPKTIYNFSFRCKKRNDGNSQYVILHRQPTSGSNSVIGLGSKEVNEYTRYNGSFLSSAIGEFRFTLYNSVFLENTLMIEEGTLATEYEEYKEDKKEILLPYSNGLKEWDIIDFENGNITQKADKYTITGDENWSFTSDIDRENTCNFYSTVLDAKVKKGSELICDKFINRLTWQKDYEGIAIEGNGGFLRIRIEKTKLETPTVAGLKKWLQTNPTTVVYEVEAPIVHNIEKTYSLKTFNNTTHIFQLNNICGELSVTTGHDRDSLINSNTKEIQKTQEIVTDVFNSLAGRTPVWMEQKWDNGILTILNSIRRPIRDMIVKGKTIGGYNVLTGQSDNIVSSGEAEGNKIIVKSCGKNLLSTKSFKSDTSKISILKEPFFMNENTTYSLSWRAIKCGGLAILLSNTYSNATNHDTLYREVVADNKGREIIFGAKGIPIVNTVYKYMYITSHINNPTGIELDNLMLEQGTLATDYKEYKVDKKEILLPFAGGLKEWDLVKYGVGQIEERSQKKLFNGGSDENWRAITATSNTLRFAIDIDIQSDVSGATVKTISDKLPSIPFNTLFNTESEGFATGNSNTQNILNVRVLKSKLETLDVAGFKKWLQANPTTVVYELATPIIHNIEKIQLSAFDGTTNIIQENAISGSCEALVPIDFKASLEKPQQKINKLENDLTVKSEYFHSNDLTLTHSDLELDFRLMEIEYVLDIPIKSKFKGGRDMAARTPYEMIKVLIVGGSYDREDMEYKISMYVKRGRMTEAEAEELIALMDADKLQQQ